MAWILRSLCVLATFASCLSVATSQPPAKDAEPAKAKELPKSKDAKEPLSVEKLKVPSGGILVLIDDLREALQLAPKLILLRPEQYQELLERIDALEKAAKADRVTPSRCVMTGKLEGDLLVLRADFSFRTEQPNASVLLGLAGAHLVSDEGNRQPLALDYTEEGYVVSVPKEGDHHVQLQVRVPVQSRASPSERGFKLGLSGAAIASLTLELPGTIKELRWNERTEKAPVRGRWEIWPERAKALDVSWTEPIATPGTVALPTAEGMVQVRCDETHVSVTTDLALKDLRGLTKEWHLQLPTGPGTDVKVTPPGAGTAQYELIPPDGKTSHYVLRVYEALADRWTVTAKSYPGRAAAGAKLPIGPFFVQGAVRQKGTLTVQVKADALPSQRLIYHRGADLYQRDVPKQTATAENEGFFTDASFQYWDLPNPVKPGKNAKSPLEIEIRAERGRIETKLEHLIKLRPEADGIEIELHAKIQGKAANSGEDALELALPSRRPRIATPAIFVPGTAFPAALQWPTLARMTQESWFTASEIQVFDDGRDRPQLDLAARPKLVWPRILPKQFTTTLLTRLVVPAEQSRVRLELPRVLGTVDLGASVHVQASDTLELLVGPPGAEEPVPERQNVRLAMPQAPATIDLSWRPFRRELTAEAIVDVTVHQHTAQVKQALVFQLPGGGESSLLSRSGQVPLSVPAGVHGLAADGKRLAVDARSHAAWLPAREHEDQESILSYDVDLPRSSSGDGEERDWEVPLVWPKSATHQRVKLRVWSPTGLAVSLSNVDAAQWQDRGLQVVAGEARLPSLAAEAEGPSVPVRLHLRGAPSAALAPFLADRALLQIRIEDDETQLCRARYFLRRLNADTLDLELPVAPRSALQQVSLGGVAIQNWQAPPGTWNIARIPVPPSLKSEAALLELVYALPQSLQQGRTLGKIQLFPPVFLGGPKVDEMRWQVSLPAASVAMATSRLSELQYRWTLQGLLLAPGPLSSAEMETWLTGKPAEAAMPATLTFARVSDQPQMIWYLPRPLWLLAWSGTLLAVSLTLIFLSMPHGVRLVLAALVGSVALGASLIWPAALPAAVYGCQPGAVVLLVVLLFQLILHERYRRQVLFMPGTSRRPGSTLSRPVPSAKRPLEVSTVDAPANLERVGESPTSSRSS